MSQVIGPDAYVEHDRDNTFRIKLDFDALFPQTYVSLIGSETFSSVRLGDLKCERDSGLCARGMELSVTLESSPDTLDLRLCI